MTLRPFSAADRRAVWLFCVLLAATISRADSPARTPPHQRLATPAPQDVIVDGEFWGPRIRTCRDVTVPYCIETCKTTGRIANFLKASGKAAGAFEGAHFNDSDVYKIVEGADRMLAVYPDAERQKAVDAIVAEFAAAQQPDGYLDTFFTIDRRAERFRHISRNARHELYCMGHAIEAGATRFELRGERDFLEVARRLADHIGSVFGPGKRGEVPEHQELELALIKLYRVTGEKRYLDLARFFIEERGNAAGHDLYGAYSQDHLPIREQSEIVGHAVRAMYNCCGVADLYAESGDPELLAALRRLWKSTTWRKMYVTGGVGATRHGEAFSHDYHLPNATAYSETCAQIGLALFAHRMLLIEPRAEYADVLERVLYNSFLSGLSLSGDRFFYQNRLASRGDYRRQPWYGCACCPSNVVRVYPRIGELAWSSEDDAIWAHLYVGGTARLKTASTVVTVRQRTGYPWNGSVSMTVTPQRASRFGLCLRIPGWCREQQTPGGLYVLDATGAPPRPWTVKVNGEPIDAARLANGYLKIARTWKAGDVVELDLPMPIRRVRAHPRISQDRGRVALQRGPIVYCLEGADHDAPLDRVVLPPDAKLKASHRGDVLGGVTVLEGTGRVTTDDGEAKNVDLVAIPYYVWDNRAAGDMAVWLVEDPDRAGPYKTAGWVGSNYTPAYCVNQVQMWHEFRPEVIDRELAAAKRWFGITTLRVYLHDIPYVAEKDVFLANIENFLRICARHDIRPGFVFFDDCHRHDGITLESLPPVKGWHNGRWAACPQDRDRKPENMPRFKSYVQDVIRAHADDRRVLWWEIFNEPHLRSKFSADLRLAAYGWAKEVAPIQPVLSCWDDNPATDIVDAHNYAAIFSRWDRQADLNPAKGAVFTEAGARWYAPRPSNGEPCEVVHWLTTRKEAGKYVPGVYLCWELMVGNSNCRWYWGTEPNTPEPTVPWCGLMWPDATPVSFAEAESVRRYVTGKRRALFFDDFQTVPPLPPRPGWTAYGDPRQRDSGVQKLRGSMKLIAGDTAWSDYALEARVMLDGTGGNAGLVFRANDPGPGHDQLHGYYIGFDTEKLYLGKMDGAWRPLAAFDLSQIECRVVPGVWNQIRVIVKGPRIRVWFNRMHHDDGLRFDITDDKNPILTGAIGLRTHRVDASFDNVVVLPLSALGDLTDE